MSFLNKKEQVIDFQLTPYGKHRLSVGQLKPAYYAFFDTGVTYDSQYAGFDEAQSKIHERIKTETQFIEGILFFEEAENTVPASEYVGELGSFVGFDHETGFVPRKYLGFGVFSPEFEAAGDAYMAAVDRSAMDSVYSSLDDLFLAAKEAGGDASGYTAIFSFTSLFDLDIVPKKYVPKPNVLSFESAIGDAKFEGENTQFAPSWKLLACQGEITNVETKDTTSYNHTPADYDNEITEFNIPQVDISANYVLEISTPTGVLAEEIPSDFISETKPFLDGNTIKLIKNDVMVYAEEVNTQLLTENFDVEVFEMIEDAGEITKATATLSLGEIDVGDTITINDGIRSRTFEFIANGGGGAATVPSAGNIGVVVSSNYLLAGTTKNRVGTILNLISAINQDDGSTTRGYPTDYDKGSTGAGAPVFFRGRCRTIYGPGCYTDNHNLQISIDESQISEVAEHDFASLFELRLTNQITTRAIDVNKTITTTAAAARIVPSGFSGGYISKGVELKRKYFTDSIQQIVDGFMVAATEQSVKNPNITADSVEYYFNILTDKQVSDKIACSCASTFNRDSYYIDIDFDCVEEDLKRVYYDIYGSATLPEVCNPPVTGPETPTFEELQPDTDVCED